MLKLERVEKSYIPESERGKTDAAQFRLRALPSAVQNHITDRCSSFERGADRAEAFIKSGTMQFMTVQYGVVGFSNLVDAEGQPMEADTEKDHIFGNQVRKLTAAQVNELPVWLVEELYYQILDMTHMRPGEAKNSESPPASPPAACSDNTIVPPAGRSEGGEDASSE